MEKTKGKQKPQGLKNSRYWENVIPKKETQAPQDPKKLPDCRNGERQKALH